ncbi:MAG: hypothetical protein R3F43_17285 [bacterium]
MRTLILLALATAACDSADGPGEVVDASPAPDMAAVPADADMAPDADPEQEGRRFAAEVARCEGAAEGVDVGDAVEGRAPTGYVSQPDNAPCWAFNPRETKMFRFTAPAAGPYSVQAATEDGLAVQVGVAPCGAPVAEEPAETGLLACAIRPGRGRPRRGRVGLCGPAGGLRHRHPPPGLRGPVQPARAGRPAAGGRGRPPRRGRGAQRITIGLIFTDPDGDVQSVRWRRWATTTPSSTRRMPSGTAGASTW